MGYFRKRTFSVLAIVVASLTIGLLICMLLLWLSFDTEYSMGFTEQLWGQVQIGMSEVDVKLLLGEPLSEVPWSDKGWNTLNYTKSRSGNGNYIHYYIVFHDGKLVEKHKGVFWD